MTIIDNMNLIPDKNKELYRLLILFNSYTVTVATYNWCKPISGRYTVCLVRQKVYTTKATL